MKDTFSDADMKELRQMADFNCRLYTSEQSMLHRAADEIERVRSENNLHRAIRDHSVYCRCEQCQQIRDILGEPYRR